MQFTIAAGARAPVVAKGPPEDRAQVVLELARLRAFDRPVPAVVHPRRDLVCEQRAADIEQFDTADADIFERVEQRKDARFRLCLQRAVVAARGCPGAAQDAVAVLVLDDGPAAGLSTLGSHRDDRELARERHERLEDQRDAAEVGPRAIDIGGGPQHRLPLAVVAAAPGLQHRGEAERGDGPIEVGAGVDRVEPRGRDRQITARFLLREPVLGDLERARGRPHRRDRCEMPCGAGGHTLPLVRDHARAFGRLLRGNEVVEPPVHDRPDHCRGRRLGGVEERASHAER